MRNTVASTNFFAYDACAKCGQLNRTDATWCSQCRTSLALAAAPMAAARTWYQQRGTVLRIGVPAATLLVLSGLCWWCFAH